MSLEVVNYLILERPAVDITTGAMQTYTLTGHIKGNFAFWPIAQDTLANALGPHTVDKIPSLLKDHNYDPTRILSGSIEKIVK